MMANKLVKRMIHSRSNSMDMEWQPLTGPAAGPASAGLGREELSRIMREDKNNSNSRRIRIDGKHSFDFDVDSDSDSPDDKKAKPIVDVPQNVNDWLFPPQVPRSCQLLRLENLAVPTSYLMIGILQGLSGPFCNVYPLDIGATESQQATVTLLRLLPASFKIVFGFVSDNVPMGGYRRKSYMFLAWTLSSLSMAALTWGSNLSLNKIKTSIENNNNNDIHDIHDIMNTDNPLLDHTGTDDLQWQEGDDDGTDLTTFDTFDTTTAAVNNTLDLITSTVPLDAPSIPFLSLCIFCFATGLWWADVMADTVVAEKAKLEVQRGHLQSTCYACRFFGLMVAAPFASVLYSVGGPHYVATFLAFVPLTMLPIVWHLAEDPYDATRVKSTRRQCREIWNTVCSRAVWQPMGFKFVYNVLHVSNAAWKQYLRTVLSFTSEQLNAMLVSTYALLYVGVLIYKYYLITWSWRYVYFITTSVGAVFSLFQIMLIQGWTFGLSNFVFALGDEALSEFVMGMQFLPTTIMMVHLCPEGSEGASYSMFTTVSNSANSFHRAFSTVLLGLWDVSKEALERRELQGLINLTLLTSFLKFSGIFFLPLLPHGKEGLAELNKDSHSSKVGGAIFLTITFSCLLYSLMVGFLNVVKPGWAGES